MSSALESSEQNQFLTFLLSSQEYAISVLRVREIIEYETVTALPNAPPWIRGVLNLRGSVVPVVDLGAKFGMGERPVNRTTCIVVVEACVDGRNILMGVIVDAVSQVMDVPAGQIQPAPSFGTSIKTGYLQGLTQLEKKLVLLLDINKALTA
jgi:purine-binding chemotaxis protein CheW